MAEGIIFFENEAKNFSNLAVENDKQSNFEAAIFYYSVIISILHRPVIELMPQEAVQSILNAMRLGSQNSQLKDRADTYLKRAEDLRNKTS